MNSLPEDRLIALESRLAHFERMADDLSDVVAEQTQRIDLLTQQIRRLRDRVRELESGATTRSPQDDKPPPHY